MIKHYWDAMMENTVPFLLAWEAYVFFMLIFFISIVYRLARIEKKLNRLLRKRR
jgi:hypothetical protein|tara:strand:- start:92 stop:253 length:162 start_codon:yes stop_codon:yes gene_type:complete